MILTVEKSSPEKINSISWQSKIVTVDIFNQLWPDCWHNVNSKKKETVANTTNYPVNVSWQYLSTDKIWNLLVTFSTLWPCMNHSLSVHLMHFCSLSSFFTFCLSHRHLMPLCLFENKHERESSGCTPTLEKIAGQLWMQLVYEADKVSRQPLRLGR